MLNLIQLNMFHNVKMADLYQNNDLFNKTIDFITNYT